MKMKTLYYNPNLKELSKKLKKAGVMHEVLLWRQLKSRQLNGLSFVRQKIIGNYIVDFYNALNKVIIEVDGFSHDIEKKAQDDIKRDEYFKSLGLTVIRISAKDVLQKMDVVMKFLGNHEGLQNKLLTTTENRKTTI
jgi:very-short-patch-repair endonuclease